MNLLYYIVDYILVHSCIGNFNFKNQTKLEISAMVYVFFILDSEFNEKVLVSQ